MKLQAQNFLDQAWNIMQKYDLKEDPYLVRFGPDLFLVRSISTNLALHAAHVPTLGKALASIESSELMTTTKRRHMLFEIFRAEGLFAQKLYAEATEKALVALSLSEEIKSYRGKQEIEKLYEKLATTNYGGSPQVASLKWKLQQWGKGKKK